MKIPLDPALMSPTILSVIREGRYETGEAKVLLAVIEEGERIVELGGGIGFLSSLAYLQGKTEAIVVVEAHPELIPVIKATHQLNGVRGDVRHAVAAPRRSAGTLPFYMHNDFWGSSLSPLKKRHLKGVAQVAVVGLDELVETYAPTMMIIDVEGGEADLLDGVSLRGVNKVLMEIHPKVIGPAGVKKVFDALSLEGFAYDPWTSMRAVVMFRRVDIPPI